MGRDPALPCGPFDLIYADPGLLFSAWSSTLRDGRETVFEAMVNDLAPALRQIYRDSPEGPVQDVRIFTQVMDDLGLTEDWPLTKSGLLLTSR